MNSILYNGKVRVENQTKTRVYAQKSRLKMPLKNSISCLFLCQDYDDFDVANEDDLLEEFLGLPRKNPKVGGIPIVFSHTCFTMLNVLKLRKSLFNTTLHSNLLHLLVSTVQCVVGPKFSSCDRLGLMYQ